MKKICFVILHYEALEDTIECVDSILKNVEYEQYKIIIVDNKSPNKSGILLEKKYLINNKIKVILSNKNLGFAKGNNLGYEYAKKKFNSDFIIMINNDTIIEQKNFIDLIIETYERTDYYLLGPDILSLKCKNYHQNPISLKGLTKHEVKKRVDELDRSYRKCLIKYLTHTDFLIKFIKKHIFKSCYKNNESFQNSFIRDEVEGAVLHGSCIIFSSNYINNSKFAFYPETYMYMEEDILHYLCSKNNYKIIYNPKIKILHKEDVSTDSILTTSIKKDLFSLKNGRNSAKILYKLMSHN